MKCLTAASFLLLIVGSAASCQTRGPKTLTVGDTIPAFTLRDQDGNLFNSTDHLGKSDLVIFFYPKDESMVCTKEACIGINGGTAKSHQQFEAQDHLPYPLLVDSGNSILKAFGIPRQFFMTGRKTFVVDKSGKIVFTYNSAINGARHAEVALAYLKTHTDR